ncbi:MAG: hydrogenase [Polyangiaceae bacterium]|nr:hydrogenase [Polyangiaceae bacterium]
MTRSDEQDPGRDGNDPGALGGEGRVDPRAHEPGPALAAFRNGRSLALEEIPVLSLEELRNAVIQAPNGHGRVSALFAVPAADGFTLYAVLSCEADGLIRVGRAALAEPSFPSMTPECPQVHLFERVLAERWGLVPEQHPWLKPVRFAPPWSREPDLDPPLSAERSAIALEHPYRIDGSSVHEVAVGPVHAGVIEPGHFRFQCHGELVMHLEISLGYQHRGIDRALAGGPAPRTIPYVETLAGDTTIGHTLAHCELVEALSATRVPPRALSIRAIALELERLANHVGDLGALAGDVGYLPTASFCGRLRGDLLNLSAALCGSRFGRGLVRPGGVAFDLEPERVERIAKGLEATLGDVGSAVTLLWESPSVMERFENTGVLTPDTADALGLVGVVARAAGLDRDVRHDFPAGMYRLAQIPTSVARTGDVFARAYVRWLEVQRSGRFLHEQLRALPAGPVRRPAAELRPGRLAVSLVEGWRGEICHVAITDAQGRFAAYEVVDPSFHNWTGLALALRDQAISDFPLCNKSFNLSYCGHDL